MTVIILRSFYRNSVQIEMLPKIVEVTNNTGIEVYVDGGIRTGTDVLKALALGARAVFIGRPILWGLAVKVCIFRVDVEANEYITYTKCKNCVHPSL